jgi:hypothetical protein
MEGIAEAEHPEEGQGPQGLPEPSSRRMTGEDVEQEVEGNDGEDVKDEAPGKIPAGTNRP